MQQIRVQRRNLKSRTKPYAASCERDLSLDQKTAVEALLGRTVSNEEAVSVPAVVPASAIPSQLSKQERDEALHQIDAYFAKAR